MKCSQLRELDSSFPNMVLSQSEFVYILRYNGLFFTNNRQLLDNKNNGVLTRGFRFSSNDNQCQSITLPGIDTRLIVVYSKSL
mmetsp:Transcript_33042/g.48522  ORF Transcript_33042/g.48522 Transcript_33042/m.48522 type:complete len:83 (-) Transcript_33042:16-264(-)